MHCRRLQKNVAVSFDMPKEKGAEVEERDFKVVLPNSAQVSSRCIQVSLVRIATGSTGRCSAEGRQD